MTIQPLGLTTPTCECWQKQSKEMERMLDLVAAEVCLITIDGAIKLNICDEAKNYYLSAIIWAVMSIGIKQAKDDDGSCSMYQEEYNKLWDKLKPLVMQRIDFIDGLAL